MVERFLSLRVRRFMMLVLVVMLAFGPIGRAYADDYEGGGGASQSFNSSFGTVWYGPTASGLYVRYGVVANTRYDAAVYCCRGRSFDLNDLSPKKKSKLLSNGDFKQFAELFNASKPELTDDWSGDASIVMAWNSAKQLYGETYCWNARYTNDQKIRAQEAIEDVLNDDDTPSGGGSGSGGNSGGAVADGERALIKVERYMPTEISGTGIYNYACDYISVPKTLYDELNTYCEQNGYDIIAYANSVKYVSVFGADKDKVNWLTGDKRDAYKAVSTVNLTTKRINGTGTLDSIGDDDNAKQVIILNNTSLGNYTCSKNSNIATGILYRNIGSMGYDDGEGDDPDPDPPEPPIEWPDPPTETPQPPEVPTPGDPTQPTPPDPVDPTPGNPWIPIPNDDVQITGEDFQDLIDALNEHCIHLQDAIQTNIRQLWDLQSDFLGTQFEDLFGLISDNFAWLGNDVIADSYNDLKSYLHELFEWLSEQLNFDVQVEGGQYDDTSVLYWLKQIWAKLPTGINTRPTDPVTNPDGWWDWLTQLLNNLAADLMALGHDNLASVLETLNELRNKFPFSLPWDVAALLGLLVGVPECPEFDMPCYTVSLQGLQQVGTYHITLEPYETVWEGVKWIETLAFAVYLITHTGGLMDMVTKTVRPR